MLRLVEHVTEPTASSGQVVETGAQVCYQDALSVRLQLRHFYACHFPEINELAICTKAFIEDLRVRFIL